MKKLLVFLIPALALATATPTIVAVVNGVQITSDFLNLMADIDRILIGVHDLDEKFFNVMTNTPEGLAFLQRYRMEVLKELVDDLLIQQLAEREGVAPSNDEVEKAVSKDIDDALKRIGVKREDFEKYLESIGMSMEGLKKKLEWIYRTNLSLKNLKEKVTSKVSVTEDEIRKRYEKIRIQRKVHLYAIFLDSKEKAQQALKKLLEGEEFTKVASEMSLERRSAAKGGDLGLLDEGTLKKLFGDYADRILDADEGAILGPYSFGKSWVVFKVAEKEEKVWKYEELKEKIRQELLKEKKEKVWNEWWRENFESFKKNSEVKILLGGGGG